MAYEQREGSGALFKNFKKEGKQPDWRGDAMFKGEMIEVSGWTKPTSKGGEFISLSIKEKTAYQPKQEGSYEDEKQADKDFGLDDDLPF